MTSTQGRSATHRVINPRVLYFGTPVVLVSTENPDGTFNLAPMSSAWWVGTTCLLGLDETSATTLNMRRTGEVVPGSDRHIDPDRWDPLLMKFTHLCGHTSRLESSTLARCWQIPEPSPRALDEPEAEETPDFEYVTKAVVAGARPGRSPG